MSREAEGLAGDFYLLRYVPVDSPIHRLSAATKLGAVALLSLAVFVWPTWPAAAAMAALVAGAVVLGRIPRGAVPSIPPWIFILFAAGAFVALVSGGAPYVHVLGLRVGLGGLERWALFAVLAVELLAMATLVGWTTPLAELAPGLERLTAPLRRLRVPVDEIIAALSLSIRCLPLLLEEVRVVRAARRARQPAVAKTLEGLAREALDTLSTALLSGMRRAGELADAIESRGGAATIAVQAPPMRRRDAGALVIVALAIAAIGLASSG